MTSFMSEYIPEPGDIVYNRDLGDDLKLRIIEQDPVFKNCFLLKKYPFDPSKGYYSFRWDSLVLVERPPKIHKQMEELIKFISEILGDKKKHRELRTHEEIIYNKCQEILKEINP